MYDHIELLDLTWDEFLVLIEHESSINAYAYKRYITAHPSTHNNTSLIPPPLNPDFPFVFRRQPLSRLYHRRVDTNFIDARIIDPLTGYYIDIYILSNASISEDEIPHIQTDIRDRQMIKMQTDEPHTRAIDEYKQRAYDNGLNKDYVWNDNELMSLSFTLDKIVRSKTVDAWYTGNNTHVSSSSLYLHHHHHSFKSTSSSSCLLHHCIYHSLIHVCMYVCLSQNGSIPFVPRPTPTRSRMSQRTPKSF